MGKWLRTAIPWPENEGRPSRAAGAYLVLRDGHPLAFLERGGRSITLFAGSLDDTSWVGALASLVAQRRVKKIEVQKINGQAPAEQTRARDLLLEGGFKQGYKGPTIR